MSSSQFQPAPQYQFKLFRSPNGSTRRISFVELPSWAELAARVESLYEIPLRDVAVSYVDSDNDEVTLSSEEELQELFRAVLGTPKLQVIRFSVRDLSKERTKSISDSGSASGGPAVSLANDVASLFTAISTTIASHPEIAESVRNVVRNAANGSYLQGRMRAFQPPSGPPPSRFPPHPPHPPHPYAHLRGIPPGGEDPWNRFNMHGDPFAWIESWSRGRGEHRRGHASFPFSWTPRPGPSPHQRSHTRAASPPGHSLHQGPPPPGQAPPDYPPSPPSPPVSAPDEDYPLKDASASLSSGNTAPSPGHGHHHRHHHHHPRHRGPSPPPEPHHHPDFPPYDPGPPYSGPSPFQWGPFAALGQFAEPGHVPSSPPHRGVGRDHEDRRRGTWPPHPPRWPGMWEGPEARFARPPPPPGLGVWGETFGDFDRSA